MTISDHRPSYLISVTINRVEVEVEVGFRSVLSRLRRSDAVKQVVLAVCSVCWDLLLQIILLLWLLSFLLLLLSCTLLLLLLLVTGIGCDGHVYVLTGDILDRGSGEEVDMQDR